MNKHIEQNNSFSNNDDDIALIAKFRGGDRISFDRLVLKYQDRILNLCVRTLGNRADGEDSAQETFVKVYKNLGKFKGDSLFSTWLFRIALNTCKNRQTSWWNKLTKKAVKLDAPIKGDENEHTREIPDTSLSPEEDLKRHEIAHFVNKALVSLPPKHKELIILRDIQGLSYEEIEKIVGISLGTVKSRLARARKEMQDKLQGNIDDLR